MEEMVEVAKRRDDRWLSARVALNALTMIVLFFLSETLYRVDGVLKEHDRKHEVESSQITELQTKAEEREKNHGKELAEMRAQQLEMARILRESTASIAKDLKDGTASIARDLRESTEATTKRYELLIQKLGEKVDHISERIGAH